MLYIAHFRDDRSSKCIILALTLNCLTTFSLSAEILHVVTQHAAPSRYGKEVILNHKLFSIIFHLQYNKRAWFLKQSPKKQLQFTIRSHMSVTNLPLIEFISFLFLFFYCNNSFVFRQGLTMMQILIKLTSKRTVIGLIAEQFTNINWCMCPEFKFASCENPSWDILAVGSRSCDANRPIIERINKHRFFFVHFIMSARNRS